MQVTTLSFFRFETFWGRFWAFFQMGLAPAKLRKVPDLEFFKVVGTGRGAGFDLAPNFGVYAILATWPSTTAAVAGLKTDAFRGYATRAEETWHLFLQAVSGHGSWDGRQPFRCARGVRAPRPIGVLTRASIRWPRLVSFWRSVPAVSGDTGAQAQLRFTMGMGERPVLQLMTFSLWDDVNAVTQFAYRDGHHRQTLRRARDEDWFSEELFARFRVLDSRGTWSGRDPVAAAPALEP
ncbi:MAG: DUF3291 domain-containing protein, partial [Myxococcota bacterium]